jgi:hypothetical protein
VVEKVRVEQAAVLAVLVVAHQEIAQMQDLAQEHQDKVLMALPQLVRSRVVAVVVAQGL